ncbi:isoprenyl transferase 1 [Streptomyces albospinus]|uniref:Isoprenyl transferase n=1 Tax=Streptomyces albospinus TaxID=285515 RepID=A0ABQ2VM27_9ACTN|nr:polyprenyl diphosphate synthase [Streptomyces albospinus]GGU96169.1 isoprenyl transferase 1 [Streptomyces albospinus]
MSRVSNWRISAAAWLLRGVDARAEGAIRVPLRPPAGNVRPLHIAIIMDGNGRWATARGLPRIKGHEAGVRAVRSVLDAALDEGVGHLSLFVFSTENWRRPEAEVLALMRLAVESLRSLADYTDRSLRLRWCGAQTGLAPEVVGALGAAELRTRHGRSMTVVFCLNYGGRAEITTAAAALARSTLAGRVEPDGIDEQVFARHLLLPDLPDVDMLVRTSGEQRISNFLLWQSAYAEFFFVETLWPDFTGDQLRLLIRAFAARKRRFGALPEAR